MQWFLLVLLGLVLGAGVAVAVWVPNRSFLLRILGIVLVATLAAVAVGTFWKQAVLSLAIAAVSGLAVAVMFQKVAPRRAIAGALTAFVLLFAFSWLALKLADIFLFGKEVDVFRWIGELPENVTSWGSFPMPSPEVLAALGLALFLSSALLPRTARAPAAFAGLFLLFVFGPRILEAQEVYWGEALFLHDPLMRFGLWCLALFVILQILLSIDKGNPKQGG